MPTEPVSSSRNRDFFSDHRPDTDAAQSQLTDLPQESASRLAASLRHVPRVAMCTLAALAAQDLTHQTLAASVGDFAHQPQLKQAGNLVVPAPTEDAISQEAQLQQGQRAVASPELLGVQEFAPLAVRASESAITPPGGGTLDAVVPSLNHSAAGATRASSIAPPESEMSLARTSVQNERSLPVLQPATPQSTSTSASLQSNKASDLQAIPAPESSATLTAKQDTPTAQETLKSQPDVVAQATPKPTCLAYAPSQASQSGTVIAQGVPTGACPSAERLRQAKELQDELRGLENEKVEGITQASPALSIYIPTGFGADNNTGFLSATYQQRTRYSNVSDGGLGVGIGLGDARKAVGVELSYTAASFGRSRDFGGGGFNAKVHRQFGDDLSVAAGWNGALNLGGHNDFEQSLYGVATKIFRTRDDINLPFSRVAVTAGVGNGQFRTEDAVAKGTNNVNVFGNVALRVAQPVSLIAEWSGQDLGFGVSVTPFKNIPLTITPAVRDVVGAGDGPRFVLGSGLAFKF
ncbi:MAG TPA: hypothetical protein V6D11_00085 [Waterburya sp.]